MISRPGRQVWAYPQPVHLGRSFDTLFALARDGLGRDVRDGDVILFVSKRRHHAKVLLWDGTGLCIYAKRLERGRFNAPWLTPGAAPWRLTTTELALFLEGSRVVGHVPLSPPALAR